MWIIRALLQLIVASVVLFGNDGSHMLKPSAYKQVHHLIEFGNLELFRISFEIVFALVTLPIVAMFPAKCAILSWTPTPS